MGASGVPTGLQMRQCLLCTLGSNTQETWERGTQESPLFHSRQTEAWEAE